MLKRQLSIWAAVLALSAGSLLAMVHPHYDQGECWGFQGEYLYWLPDVESTIFVIDSTSPSSGTAAGSLIDNPFKFSSGFRVEGAFAIDCTSDLQVRYARLRSTQSKTFNGMHLWATQGAGSQSQFNYGGSASSDLTFYFQNVELLYSNRVWDSCRYSHFYVFGGLQYYHFSSKEAYSYIGNLGSQFTNRSARIDAVGPEFGFEFVCPLNMGWCGWNDSNLAVVGLASTSLVAQQARLKYSNQNSGVLYSDVNISNIWRINPAFNARAGLQYASTCWCVGFDFEIGYEFSTYLNSLSKVEDVAGYGSYFATDYNIDMQGLYVALGLMF